MMQMYKVNKARRPEFKNDTISDIHEYNSFPIVTSPPDRRTEFDNVTTSDTHNYTSFPIAASPPARAADDLQLQRAVPPAPEASNLGDKHCINQSASSQSSF